jgi:hypothetical protein
MTDKEFKVTMHTPTIWDVTMYSVVPFYQLYGVQATRQHCDVTTVNFTLSKYRCWYHQLSLYIYTHKLYFVQRVYS